MSIHSFPPISNPPSIILILGTMPGIASLEANQYYGHSRNSLWKILFHLFEKQFSTDYEIRKELLLNNNIALWDALQACVREGSLDSAIQEEVPNDFESFFQTHSNIQLIAFNGQPAAKYFAKYIAIKPPVKYITLPSTSPANRTKNYDEKLVEWSKIKLS